MRCPPEETFTLIADRALLAAKEEVFFHLYHLMFLPQMTSGHYSLLWSMGFATLNVQLRSYNRTNVSTTQWVSRRDRTHSLFFNTSVDRVPPPLVSAVPTS